MEDFCYSLETVANTKIEKSEISQLLEMAEIRGFEGKYRELGGGEVNDTYVIEVASSSIVLRVTKDVGRKTLMNEANALKLLDIPGVPRLIYFDENNLFNGRMWILVSYVAGETKDQLNTNEYRSLGRLLAKVHTTTLNDNKLDLRERFLKNCKSFGDYHKMMNHPDLRLRILIQRLFMDFRQWQGVIDNVNCSLIHQDATPSNVRVDNGKVSLIDWEFSHSGDPMCDFSTVYYEDIEYNRGKWRVKINQTDKEALFSGYESGGGIVDEKRIRFWINFDKIGAAVFLYWRLHESPRPMSYDERMQYKLDYENIINSLST